MVDGCFCTLSMRLLKLFLEETIPPKMNFFQMSKQKMYSRNDWSVVARFKLSQCGAVCLHQTRGWRPLVWKNCATLLSLIASFTLTHFINNQYYYAYMKAHIQILFSTTSDEEEKCCAFFLLFLLFELFIRNINPCKQTLYINLDYVGQTFVVWLYVRCKNLSLWLDIAVYGNTA